MRRAALSVVLVLTASLPSVAQESSDPVAQALSEGDLYSSKRKYELALDAYHKADKLMRHSSAQSYLKLALVDRKLCHFSSARAAAKNRVRFTCRYTSYAIRTTLMSALMHS